MKSVEQAWDELRGGADQGSLDKLMARLNSQKEQKHKARKRSLKACSGISRGDGRGEPSSFDAASPGDTTSPCSLRDIDHQLAEARKGFQALQHENAAIRRRAFSTLYETLFAPASATTETVFTMEQQVELLNLNFKVLLRALADSSEQCREMAIRLLRSFFGVVPDLTPYMAYFFPAVMVRVPECFTYDHDLQLFVKNVEEHEAFKRGKAIYRQSSLEPLTTGATENLDKVAPGATSSHRVTEPSEEVRLLLCQMVHSLVATVLERGAGSVLHTYFHELILFFQSQLHDPYPDVRVEACSSIVLLAQTHVYELGMKLYAIALARALLPLFRHRLAKVRIAAIDALRAVVQVPNRDKSKGAGTEAIVDLVGFREDNVIPVCAFYQPDVSINYLAEVAQDTNPAVRLHVVLMLADWLVNLPDRYDYETRLCPYVLHFLTDPVEAHQTVALNAVSRCGELYESEHTDEVIERRQYGVDGDDRCNHSKPLPPPFTHRPRIGARLYVRGTTRRILRALLEELCNWVCKTRRQSALLLRTLIIYNEEHLVSEFHQILPHLYKALRLAQSERDAELCDILLQCDELLGRFVLPDTYVPLIAARLDENPVEVVYGVDEANKAAVVCVLEAMVQGSPPKEVLPHMQTLVKLLVDEQAESTALWHANVKALTSLLDQLHHRGKALIEAHFLNTGRLASLHSITFTCFRYLTVCMSRFEHGEIREMADRGMRALLAVDPGVTKGHSTVEALIDVHGGTLLTSFKQSNGGASGLTSNARSCIRHILGAWPAGWLGRHLGEVIEIFCALMRHAPSGTELGSLALQLTTCLKRTHCWASSTYGPELHTQVLSTCLSPELQELWLSVAAARLSLLEALFACEALTLSPARDLDDEARMTAAVSLASGALRDRTYAADTTVKALKVLSWALDRCRPSQAKLSQTYGPFRRTQWIAAEEAMEAILEILNDCHPITFAEACDVLCQLVSYVDTADDAVDCSKTSPLEFSTVVKACLERLIASTTHCGCPKTAENVIDCLDGVLRRLAELNPCQFLSLVRDVVARQYEPETSPEDLQVRISALADHAKLLMSLPAGRCTQ